MAAIAFPNDCHTATLPSGPTYSYVHIRASPPTQPTVLLLHGFPSSSHDWRFQIAHLRARGYGVLAPDLLGYGDTDRPSDAHAYRGAKMAAEMAELLDVAGLQSVHGVAHDWGTFLLGRMANYYPRRLRSVSFLVVGYRMLGEVVDVDAVNRMSKEKAGFEVLGYWKFMERADAGAVIARNFDSFYSLCYCEDPDEWKVHMAPLGAIDAWARSGKTLKVGSWAPDKATLRAIMKDDFDPAINWYRAMIQGLNVDDEKAALASGQTDGKLRMPVLMLSASRDPLAAVTESAAKMGQYAADLRNESLSTGHWVQLEEADKVNAILEDFVASVEARGEA